ncbi:MAG: RIP metalloprotease RseP [Alphaproteobacteria bacterium]
MEYITLVFENFYTYVLPFLIVLGVLVFVHEWGHFIVARLCGVKIETFSIGFGPELYAYKGKKTGTRWRLAVIPLGGYVKMFGDDDPASATTRNPKTITKEEKKYAFFAQPLWQRALIVAAGPLINFLFAVIALGFLFHYDGQPYSLPLVKEVLPKSAALKSGMKVGDEILFVDGKKLLRFEDLQRIVQENAGTSLKVVVKRGKTNLPLNVTPRSKEVKDRFGRKRYIGHLGIIGGKPQVLKQPMGRAFKNATVETYDMTIMTLQGVWDIIIGVRSTKDLGGPLRIAQMSSEFKQEGLASFIWFMAILSMNLGLINLFPIPVLDGGHLVFYFFEGVLRRPLHERAQEYMVRIGVVLVSALILLVTWNDIVSLKVFDFVKNIFT